MLITQIVGDLSDEDIIKYPNLVESWTEGVSYDVGKRVSYNGTVYKIIEAIKTSSATPDNSPKLSSIMIYKILRKKICGGSFDIRGVIKCFHPEKRK